MVLLEEKFLKMREILKNIKKFKPFDWILIGLTFILVLIFTFVFFRNSIYKVVTIEVTQESTYAWEVWDASGSKMWFSDLFHKGMKERDGLGNVKAELLDTFSYEKTPARITVYLTTKLRVVYNRASNTYTYKGTPVLIGSKIKVNFDNLKPNEKNIHNPFTNFPNHSCLQCLCANTCLSEAMRTWIYPR